MFLASTSDIIRVVTGSAVSTIGVQASWADNASGSTTPGRTNTNITTATTTTIVASPAAATVRNVRSLNITNSHASASCPITIQHYDGTTSVDIEKITLGPGEQFVMAEDGEWRHLTYAGAEYEYAGAARANLGIAGTVAETMPREQCPEANLAALVSGTLVVQAIYLKAGQVVTNISFFSATTAAGTPTNQIFALYSPAMGLVARTVDDTTNAWNANTIKTLALTAPYTVPFSGCYYVGIMVAATTVPTLKGLSRATLRLTALMPGLILTSAATGLTTALPDAITTSFSNGSTFSLWAAVT